jgi:hypothetical protein
MASSTRLVLIDIYESCSILFSLTKPREDLVMVSIFTSPPELRMMDWFKSQDQEHNLPMWRLAMYRTLVFFRRSQFHGPSHGLCWRTVDRHPFEICFKPDLLTFK